ncbi:hypothetical protein DGM85_04995 [Xanthomonas phaseoli pv. phaseoli]|nr:hypothetical protein DGM93_17545 [Xanthomonas phaseoli pv. phaseoli]QWN27984.1 hypothetical protein DGM85_04995 [Xanthomonas phaseoli pv. phaseoli]QWN34179.1 hypothetical protein DGM81_17305 [Xanthomonas phaseoli pv. phaseoli]
MLSLEHSAHPPSPLALARSPSRDLTRHGCRVELTRTSLQRVPRWWAGKGPAAKPQIISPATVSAVQSPFKATGDQRRSDMQTPR